MREQQQRLGKVASSAGQALQLGTGITQTTNISPTQIATTSGQRLASALGIVADVGVKIVNNYTDERNKEQILVDKIEATTTAKNEANTLLDKIHNDTTIPPEKREEAYLNAVNSSIDNVKTKFKNQEIQGEVFQTYVNTTINTIEPYANKVRSDKFAAITEDNLAKVKTYIADTKFKGNFSLLNNDSEMISKTYGVSKADVAKYWLESQLLTIDEQYTGGLITPKGAIDSIDKVYNTMVSPDNPNLKDNPVYKKAILTAKEDYITKEKATNTELHKLDLEAKKDKVYQYQTRFENATTDEERQTIKAEAYTDAVNGTLGWENFQIFNKFTKDEDNVYVDPNSSGYKDFAILKIDSYTNPKITETSVWDMQKENKITAKQANQLITIVKERQATEEKLSNKGLGDSLSSAKGLLSEVTHQDMMNFDAELDKKSKQVYVSFYDRINKGENPYKVAKELTDKYFPAIKGAIKVDERQANPIKYMKKEYGLPDISVKSLSTKGIQLFKQQDKTKSQAFLTDLNELYTRKHISMEDVKKVYDMMNNKR